MTQRLLLLMVSCLTSWTLSAQSITSVRLDFTDNSGNTVSATASDSGSGFVADGSISLSESTEYALSIALLNGSNDITSEVTNNPEQYQFFFGFSEALFDRPNGDGNIDNAADPILYTDMDGNSLPVGLSSDWITACTNDGNTTGALRVILKNQPGTKTATSDVNVGTTDFDISWDINVVDNPDAPACENEEEEINEVVFTFTPAVGGDPVISIATDPDGPGPTGLVAQPINLDESTQYELSITLANTVDMEDITAEILEEDDEHQFFFGFGEDIFDRPNGDGNLDNEADPILYNDEDDNGLPLGLSTTWITACTNDGNSTGKFRVILKHQPGQKTATSDINVGGTDIDIEWDITVVDNPDAPACENEEEEINEVVFTFTPAVGGDPVVSIATDPDGPGPSGLVAQPINLDESTQYELSITLANTFDMEDITAEILEEDDEHQFFFGFGEDLFDRPNGDGNLDNEADPIIYNDEDDNGLPLGLSTTWITACTNDGNATGKFRVILKHQPGQKTATSDINVGGTDIDIEWDITIVDNPDAPACENEEEEINEVVFTFIPAVGGDPVVSTATDPDGPGPSGLVAEPISLDESKQYELRITLANTFDMEDITAEILEEDDEHQFFFGFDENLFDRPNGDGNLDNEADPILYNDEDDNGLPLGLSTTWITACTNDGDVTGKFRVILKHQPGQKTATSDINVGGTDIDIEWDITILDNSDASDCENEEEEINEVMFIFTPTGGGDPIISTATDPDGPGPASLTAEDIDLAENTEYELSVKLANTFDMEDITAEILEEDDEHQFFFAWTGDIFSDPMGDGNIDNRDDPVNYNDKDENDLPVGLSTNWTTSEAMTAGTLRVVLKHQPGAKNAMSTFNDGGTDIDITFNINAIVSSTNNLRPDQRLTIAPNPVQNNLYFLTRNIDLSQSTMVIYNSVGAQVKTLRNPNNEINISDLAPGMYTVVIRGEQLRWNGRFIKTNN